MTARCAKLLAVLTALFLNADITDGAETTSLRGGSNAEERRRLRKLELVPGARIIAQFKSKRGHKLAGSCAKKVIRDDENEIVFEGNGECMHRIQDDPDIDADFDFPVKVLGQDVSNRMLNEVLPWGLEKIKADQLQKGEHDILVCVVDSGVAVGHPDFGNHQMQGVDSSIFYRDQWRWNEDLLGHGTGVAGILATVGGNDIGLAGAGLNLYVTRGIGDDGRGYESDVQRAVKQCVDAGANIINLSIGGSHMSVRSARYYKQVVEDEGIMMVSASGNDGNTRPVYPASHESVISVSGVYEFGGWWGHSSYGLQVELAAPAHNILSTGVTTSSLEVDGHIIEGYHIAGTGTETVAGKMAFCDNGRTKCKRAKDKICLMTREDNDSIEDMLDNCKSSKGAGAIIFDPVSDAGINAWTVDSDDFDFPAMAVTAATGADLFQNKLDDNVVIGGSIVDGSVVSYTYENMSGTSFAAPHVVAAAALVWSHYGSKCTNHQVRYALAVSAQDPHNESGFECDDKYGHGIVDAKAAYDWLQAHDCGTWNVPTVSKGGCTTLEGELVMVDESSPGGGEGPRTSDDEPKGLNAV